MIQQHKATLYIAAKLRARMIRRHRKQQRLLLLSFVGMTVASAAWAIAVVTI